MFSERAFKAALVLRGLTQRQVCTKMGIPLPRLSSRINGHTEWMRNEIQKVSEVLELTPDEVYSIFFAKEVN